MPRFDEFTLDRERLTAKMLDDYGEPVGIDAFGESDPERIAQATRVRHLRRRGRVPRGDNHDRGRSAPDGRRGDPLTL